MNVHRGSCSSLGLLLVLAVVFWPAPASAGSPGITVTEETVTISLAPSGRVAVVGLMRRLHGFSAGPDPNLITIELNPSQVVKTLVPGEIISGPLRGAQALLNMTVGTAVVHEFGHAYGYYSGNIPRYAEGATNSDALYFENKHRENLAMPTKTRRTSH